MGGHSKCSSETKENLVNVSVVTAMVSKDAFERKEVVILENEFLSIIDSVPKMCNVYHLM